MTFDINIHSHKYFNVNIRPKCSSQPAVLNYRKEIPLIENVETFWRKLCPTNKNCCYLCKMMHISVDDNSF